MALSVDSMPLMAECFGGPVDGKWHRVTGPGDIGLVTHLLVPELHQDHGLMMHGYELLKKGGNWTFSYEGIKG